MQRPLSERPLPFRPSAPCGKYYRNWGNIYRKGHIPIADVTPPPALRSKYSFNPREFILRKTGGAEGRDIVLYLGDAARPHEDRGDPAVLQEPGDGHPGECLAAAARDGVERPYLFEDGVGDGLALEESMGFRGPRVGGDAPEVFVAQKPLRERRERDAADPLVAERIEEAVFDPAFEHGVLRLVDQARDPGFPEDRGRLPRPVRPARAEYTPAVRRSRCCPSGRSRARRGFPRAPAFRDRSGR